MLGLLSAPGGAEFWLRFQGCPKTPLDLLLLPTNHNKPSDCLVLSRYYGLQNIGIMLPSTYCAFKPCIFDIYP